MRALMLLGLLAACEPQSTVIDLDGDGHAAAVDCDDGDASIHPDAPELCDGIDQDCDEAIDEDPTDGITAWVDEDDDGWGGEEVSVCRLIRGLSDLSGDCDDADDRTHPDADETCEDVDRDCDGDLHADAEDAFPAYADTDGDGYPGTLVGLVCELPEGTFGQALDCDESDPTIHPEAEEVCDDVDQDCDGKLGFDFIVGRDGESIAAAINSVPAGGEVCVLPGRWSLETRVQDRDVTLYGSGIEQTFLESEGRLLEVRGGRLDLVGVTVDGVSVGDGAVVWARDGAQVTLRDVEVVRMRPPVGAVRGLVVLADDSDVALERVLVSGMNLGQATDVRGAVAAVSRGRLTADDLRVRDVRGPTSPYIPGEGLLFELDDVTAELTGLLVEDALFQVPPQATYLVDSVVFGAANSTLVVSDSRIQDFGSLGAQSGLLSQFRGSSRFEDVEVVDASGARTLIQVYFGEVEVAGGDLRRNAGGFLSGASAEVTLSDVTWREATLRPRECSFFMIMTGEGSLGVDRLALYDNQICNSIFWLSPFRGDITLRNIISAGNDFNVPGFDAGLEGWLTAASPLTPEGAVGARLLIENAAFLDDSISEIRTISLARITDVDVEVRNAHFGREWSTVPLMWDRSKDMDVELDHLSFAGDEPEALVRIDTPGRLVTSGLLFDVDPEFTDTSPVDPWDWDLHLSSTSPLIDAGSPSLTDADGTRSDIGAHGGPGGGKW